MRIFFFPLPVTVAVDVAAWLLIQLGVSKLMVSLDGQKFNPTAGEKWGARRSDL